MALILRNGGSQSPDRWLKEPRNNQKTDPKERFIIQGIEDAPKQKEDFWNTINGNKVNINLLTDDDVKIVEDGSISLIVIHVPRADFNMRPVYVGENPYKGTYKRNHEGDYHATEHEIRGMIRDQNPEGNMYQFYMSISKWNRKLMGATR